MNFFQGLFQRQKAPKTRLRSLTDEQLYDKFREQNWSALKEDARIEVFQELENRNAARQNRPPARVVQEKNQWLLGSYRYDEKCDVIRIRVDDVVGGKRNSALDQLDSYFHESRHACQKRTPEEVWQDDFSANTGRLEDLPYNYMDDGDFYDLQTIEMDSNNAALDRVLELRGRFADEEQFREYVQDRLEHFRQVNEKWQKWGFRMDEERRRNVYDAMREKDILPKEALQLREFFEEHKEGSVQAQSRAQEERLGKLSRKLNESKEQAENAEGGANRPAPQDLTAEDRANALGQNRETGAPNTKQRAILDSADGPAQNWETGTPNAKQRAILDSAGGPAQNWETGMPNAKQRAILDSADGPAQNWETGAPNAKQRAILDSAGGPAQNRETGTPNAKQRAILEGRADTADGAARATASAPRQETAHDDAEMGMER